MFANYLTITFRNLLRHKLSTFINVLGLSIGTACCLLILMFLKHEFYFDSYYTDVNSMYNLVTKTTNDQGEVEYVTLQPVALAGQLQKEFSEISNITVGRWGDAIVTAGDKTFNEHVLFTTHPVIPKFDIQLVYGNPERALKNPNEIVLSEAMAKKYFEDENALGKLIRFETRKGFEELTVVGVAKALPDNSSLQYFNCLVDYSLHEEFNPDPNNWSTLGADLVIQLKAGTTAKALAQKLSSFVQSHRYHLDQFWTRDQDPGNAHDKAKTFTFEVYPVGDTYLNKLYRSHLFQQGDATSLFVLSGIAILILVIACINFMILTVAHSANRMKEVGVRKVMGALRGQLMKQFWGEAFLICALTLIVGTALAQLLLPPFNELAEKNLSFTTLVDAKFILVVIVLVTLTGFVSGSYPAIFISKFQPAKVLKGNVKIGGKNILTQFLTLFQFGLSIFLITVTIGMTQQMDYILSKDLLFNPAQVINIRTRSGFYPEDATQLVERFRTKALRQHNVISVSGIDQFNGKTFTYLGESKTTIIIPTDNEFINTLEIELKAGQNLSADRDNGVIVNEAFLRDLNLDESAIGKRLSEVSDTTLNGLTIIGVVRDFHLLSLKAKILPLMIMPLKERDGMLVRIASTDIKSTIAFLQKTWSELAPGKPFEYQILDAALQSDYGADLKWKKIVGYSSAIAISLACLGLLGLITISVTNRTKEIGIRKVLGASAAHLSALLSKDFIKLLMIANLIGLPLAVLVLHPWLQRYAYRVDLGWQTFTVAGGLVMAIALITVGFRSIKAALVNPIHSLRNE